MRFLVPVFMLLWGYMLPASKTDRIKVPGVAVWMTGVSKFSEDEEGRVEVKRKGASIRSLRTYAAEGEEAIGLSATITEFSKMKFDRDRLRFSFATTIWSYETDTEDKQVILEEKETSFGSFPAFYMKVKVVPSEEGEDPYYFDSYSIAVENKEVVVSASYYEGSEGQKAVRAWTDSLEVDGEKRGEMKEIKDDE